MNELINLGNGANVKVTMLKGQKGDDIQNIAKTSTSGLVDTYTITLTDGSTHNFTVTNGNGIVSIIKTSTVGLVDTYTITYQNGQTSTFTVTNGSNGQDVGSSNLATVELGQNASNNYSVGDYLIYNSLFCKAIAPINVGDAFILDTNIEQTTIGNEIETANGNISNADQKASDALSNIATVETTSTASKSYAVGEFLVFGNILYQVTQAIAQGDTLTIGVNILNFTISDALLPDYGAEQLVGIFNNKKLYRKMVTFPQTGQSLNSGGGYNSWQYKLTDEVVDGVCVIGLLSYTNTSGGNVTTQAIPHNNNTYYFILGFFKQSTYTDITLSGKNNSSVTANMKGLTVMAYYTK